MITRPAEAGLTIYLLHFEPRFKQAGHYLGITPTHRLAKRFEEHAAGRGSKLTAAALAAGSKLIVAALFHGATFDQEAAWKRSSHLNRRCPVCAGSLPTPDSWCYPAIVASSSPTSGWTPTDWRMLPRAARRPPVRQ